MLNPFKDIKPRENSHISKEKKDSVSMKRKQIVKKNTTLLSFGNEIEDEEDILLSEKVIINL